MILPNPWLLPQYLPGVGLWPLHSALVLRPQNKPIIPDRKRSSVPKENRSITGRERCFSSDKLLIQQQPPMQNMNVKGEILCDSITGPVDSPWSPTVKVVALSDGTQFKWQSRVQIKCYQPWVKNDQLQWFMGRSAILERDFSRFGPTKETLSTIYRMSKI